MKLQWNEDGFCTCQLVVITCATVTVCLVIITLIHGFAFRNGRDSRRS